MLDSYVTVDGNGARVVALIAAHNAEHSIGSTLRSLATQSPWPDEVIVIADRCTDRTAEIAASLGARVFETLDNGGSTQALTNRFADALKCN